MNAYNLGYHSQGWTYLLLEQLLPKSCPPNSKSSLTTKQQANNSRMDVTQITEPESKEWQLNCSQLKLKLKKKKKKCWGKPATCSFCLQTLDSSLFHPCLLALPLLSPVWFHTIIVSCLIYSNSLLTDLPAFSPICPIPHPFCILYPRELFLKCQAVHVIFPFKSLQSLSTALC